MTEDPYGQIEKRARISEEIRKARTILLAVAVVMFAKDNYTAWHVHAADWAQDQKYGVTIVSSVILSYRLVLWWFARYRPLLCLSLALIGLWGFYIFVAIANGDPGFLYSGLLYKVCFTIVLVQGIRSANKAERLRKELEQVFG